jgi:hypothetical protein
MAWIQAHPWLFFLLVVWSLIWKAVAEWHAARNRQLAWYIVLWLVNTAGILEIIYLAFFRHDRNRRLRG